MHTQPIEDDNTLLPEPEGWLAWVLGQPVSRGTADDRGCAINYFEWGDPADPPLILLHGFLSHAGCYAAIGPYLAKDHHVIAYDLSGMGDSGTREIYSDETRVAELMAVARQTGLFDHARKPVIIAHSYGGNVAIETMQAHHGEFAGVIICDLMALRPEHLARHFSGNRPPGSQDPDRPNKIYPDYETARGRYVLSPKQKVEEPYLLEYMAYHSMKRVDGGWSWKFDPGVFRRDTTREDRWERQGPRIVGAPGRKAVIYGQRSLLFTDDSADYLRELGGDDFPIIPVPNARHHLMLDQPIAFATALLSVLEMWRAADRAELAGQPEQ